MQPTRVFLTEEPDLSCHWIHHNEQPPAPVVGAFRCVFSMPRDATVRLHVSADERYQLWLDGEPFGRGPERGDLECWAFESYDLPLSAGEHTLVARVWALGQRAPFAQIGLKSGFFCAPDNSEWTELLGTGVAPWQSQILKGYEFLDPVAAWGTGDNIKLDGAQFSWNFQSGGGENWWDCEKGLAGLSARGPQNFDPQHLLCPATLPPMLAQLVPAGHVRLVSAPQAGEVARLPIRAQDNLETEAQLWQSLFDGTIEALIVPPHSRRRVILDLENYFCAYPELQVSGGEGSQIRLHWQEALFEEIWKVDKGNRDEIEGKFFVPAWNDAKAVADIFLPDGGANRRFDTLWWQCGRYVEILVETVDEPLSIQSILFHETRYPIEMESRFETSDERLSEIVPMMVRGLQMCSHETYMDCPFYEQLMYIGDTRLQALTTFIMTDDTRLPRKALSLFDASRLRSGLTQSRYPSRVRQIIAPFSLWYAAMVHDFWMWRDAPAFVRDLMPGVRGVIDHFVSHLAVQGEFKGLLMAPAGWNYLDWVTQWKDGTPPDGEEGSERPSGALNWQFALVLNQVAELEDGFGEPELASRARRLSAQVAAQLKRHFWNETRGLFADDVAQQHFSQHSQALAILSGHLSDAERERVGRGLAEDTDLARATIYFSHYVFEAFRVVGRPGAFLKDLALWFELVENGLKTTVEMPEPTRSDCHAWGAHPLFHYHATLAGIRPAAPGFAQVKIAPQPGPLTWIRSTTPHPRGEIRLDLKQDGAQWRGEISLPEGVSGELVTRRGIVPLAAGTQTLDTLEF
jgi:hypothetical protein